jgi:hypothetical protein
MEWYFIGAFVLWCAFIFIKWQIDYHKWKGPTIKPGSKHNKETTATTSSDASIPPGFKDTSTQNSITSATNGFDGKNDLSNNDIRSVEGSGSDTGYDGGYDSGGYDSGGGYS